VRLELLDSRAPEVESLWRELDQPASRSFFTSWAWMGNWLACLPPEYLPQLAVLRDLQGKPVSAFFLRGAPLTRLRMIKSNALYFNCTGNQRFDNLTIEYNGVVGREVSIGQLIDHVPGNWDELFLPALRPDAFHGLSDVVHRGYRVRIERTVPAHMVDLARVRESGYIPLLGKKTRAHIRRSQREGGIVETEFATDLPSALSIYRDMVALHQAQWHARGEPGAFADPWFDRFHRRLIADRFAHGEIQLVRLRSKDGPVAALYSFIHGGRVLQYQSGRALVENENVKPGYLAHTAAIEHNAKAGLNLYDFMGGDVHYKECLATSSTSLVWARVQRLRLRFLVEDRLREMVRARRAAREPSRP